MEQSRWIPFEPEIGADARALRTFAKRLATAGAKELRADLLRGITPPQLNGDLRLRFVQSLLLDLAEQGWDVAVERGRVRVRSPFIGDEEPDESKDRIRRGHLVARDSYLRERAVREFVQSMEQRRLTATGWHSIYSLMRDGDDLARSLAPIADIEDVTSRATQLATVIQPYLQVVESGERCQYTGLLLSDVWRYFRLTWVNAPKSVPGRSMMLLVRDAAAPNHPVIGIAALGSSVVQQEFRDNWIGWNTSIFLQQLQQNPTARVARWLTESLQTHIKSVYVRDLIRDHIVSTRELRHPTEATLDALRTEAARAKEQHHKFPDAPEHKRRSRGWIGAAETHLFRFKRCELLANLLTIRAAFEAAGFDPPTKVTLARALEDSKFRFAVGQLVRLIKAEHVGIDMMDITVCGAIAPYNHLLGGKLVCMLLTSPEVVGYYRKRYIDQESVIASSMQGTAVRRKPKLVLLCTTSLYGRGSSQYNRVRIPADEIGGEPGAVVEYKPLGLSKGFGSFHFTSTTVELINTLLARLDEGTKVNSIFGEGVNPRMRKIRQALEHVRLPSDALLKHGSPRVVYAIALAKNFREVLLGLDRAPKYFLPVRYACATTADIAAYWQRRWLAGRITKPGVLNDVAQHTLSYPVVHGARVVAPASDGEETETLW